MIPTSLPHNGSVEDGELLPRDWPTSRFRYATWVRARLGWRALKAEEYVDDGVSFLSTPDIKGSRIEFNNVNFISRERYDESPEIKLRRGDVLLAKDGSTLGTANVVRELPRSATVNSSIAVITPRPQLDPIFLYYSLQGSVLKSLIAEFRAGMGVPHLFQDDIKQFPIPIPPIEEQRAIADYLDDQTGKIDALIAKQGRLIETLAERLDGAWSSEVDQLAIRNPGVRLRRVIDSIVDGPFGSALASAHYSESGAGVVRLGNIGIDEFKMEDRAFIPTEYAAQLMAHAVQPGDVVVAGLGDERMPLGRAAIVPNGFGSGIVKADCYRVRPGAQATAPYLAWILSSPQSRTQFRALSRGSTRQRLNTQIVRDVVIPLPALNEQERAVTRFRETRRATAALSAKALEMIDVLKERRQALISAAVAGKIGVRGLA